MNNMYSARFLSANWFFTAAITAFKNAPLPGESGTAADTKAVVDAYTRVAAGLSAEEKHSFVRYMRWMLEQPQYQVARQVEQILQDHDLSKNFRAISGQLLNEGCILAVSEFLRRSGMTEQTLKQRHRQHRIFLLCHPDEDGGYREDFIPAFFAAPHYPPDALEAVCKIIFRVNSFRAYQFFTTPAAVFENKTPLELIEAGESERVIEEAKRLRSSVY